MLISSYDDLLLITTPWLLYVLLLLYILLYVRSFHDYSLYHMPVQLGTPHVHLYVSGDVWMLREDTYTYTQLHTICNPRPYKSYDRNWRGWPANEERYIFSLGIGRYMWVLLLLYVSIALSIFEGTLKSPCSRVLDDIKSRSTYTLVESFSIRVLVVLFDPIQILDPRAHNTRLLKFNSKNCHPATSLQRRSVYLIRLKRV